jgi:threonine aldolase
VDELMEFGRVCKAHGVYFGLDVARLHCALAKDLDYLRLGAAGTTVDFMTLDLGKAGAGMGSALLIFNRRLAGTDTLRFQRRGGGDLAQSWRISAGVIPLFQDEMKLYLESGRIANDRALELAKALKAIGVKLTEKVDTNAVFFEVSPEQAIRLQKDVGGAVAWDRYSAADGRERVEMRILTSAFFFKKDIKAIVRLLRS